MKRFWLFLVAVLAAGPLVARQNVLDAAAIEAEIHRTGSAVVYGINFEAGTPTVTAGSAPVLTEIVKLLKNRTDWRFEVQGYTDNVGPAAANLALSEQRARTVVEWLTRNGIDRSRLVAKGYGDTKPLSDNTSDEGRAKNRRVEIKKLNDE